MSNTFDANERIAVLAARVAELEAENAKLKACVAEADDARGDGSCPNCDAYFGQKHWIDCPWAGYDAARAKVEPEP